jgi:hypothetical protein
MHFRNDLLVVAVTLLDEKAECHDENDADTFSPGGAAWRHE